MLHQQQELESAISQLAECPRIGHLVKLCPKPVYTQSTDPFLSLSRAIVFQQLSGKAASTIFARLEVLTQNSVTPESIASVSLDQMREVGVSRPKASYLHDLAAKFLDKSLNPEAWPDLPEDQVRAEITSVKGLGNWSADMFLMFALCRPDVWPTLDQGIRNAAKKILGKEEHLTTDELIAIAEPWKPYRTVAAHYLWRSLDISLPD